MPLYSANSPELSVNTSEENDQTEASVTGLAGGGFVVVWRTDNPEIDESSTAIMGQVFDSAGNPVGDEFIVNSLYDYSQLEPDVAALEDGGFVVTWSSYDGDVDGDGYGISARIFGADGEADGDEFTVNGQSSSTQYGSTVTGLEGGGFVITWHSADSDVDGDEYGISAQVFDADGDAVGSEFTVNTEAESSQFSPTVAALDGGGFVVAWHSYDEDVDGSGAGISVQIYNAAGSAVGSEITVNSTTDLSQFQPEVAGLAGGGFVVTWYGNEPEEEGGDGDGRYVAAQVFDASGDPVGNEILVNTAGDGDQSQPNVTALPDGGFVISWTTDDTSADGAGSAIVAQVFDGDGTKVGDEFVVNTGAEGAQLSSDLSLMADGSFVAVWTTSDDFGQGIAARVYSLHETLGSAGSDVLAGTAGEDYSFALAGDDTLLGGGGSDTLNGGGGDDYLRGDGGMDVFAGGDGNDTLLAGSDDARDTVIGGAGDDVLQGGAGDDLLVGGGFSDGSFDHLQLGSDAAGGQGTDMLVGGAGNDTLAAGDWVDGANRDDGAFDSAEFDGSLAGASSLWGGEGDDLILGGAGADRIGGGANNDTVIGGDGADTIYGGTGYQMFELNDLIVGGEGDDLIYAGDGDDSVIGGAGNDRLFSGGQNDTVDGGAGDDTLWGGSGNDIFEGGSGADVFVYAADNGHDRILDFNTEEDALNLAGTGFEDMETLLAASNEAGSGITITLDDENSLFLLNLGLDDLEGMTILF